MLENSLHKKESPFQGMMGMGGGATGYLVSGSSSSADGTQGDPFTSIAEAKTAGVSNGLYYFQNANVNSGTAFQLRYATYDNRGWVEVLWADTNTLSEPWDHWLNYQGGDRPYLVNYNLSNGGLNYSGGGSSVIKLHSSFNLVDFAVTSKQSRTSNGLAAGGNNQGGVLPLIASDSLAGSGASQCRQRLVDFFGGYATGFSVGAGAGGYPEDYNAYWSKNGSNGVSGPFEIHLGFREGNKTETEFHIADGNTGSGATYAPNIGFRNVTQSYQGANVGSWSDSSGGKSGYNLATNNVLSVWLSDAT